MATEIFNPSTMKGVPPLEPEVDALLLQQALNQNIKQKLVQNSLDPLGALVKVLENKAPANQAEAELMAATLEQLSAKK